jgi:two-component system, NarL family, sensor histidine kinase DesK
MHCPPKRDYGWAKYIWLAYLGFFFIQPVQSHAGWRGWLITLAGVFAFLILYFGIFRWPRFWSHVGLVCVLLLGIAYAPYNHGASTFFVYAAAFGPFLVETEVEAALLVAGVGVLVGLVTWVFHLPADFWFSALAFGLLVGISNIFFAQRDRALASLRKAQDEIEHLAKVAERERIARDLHDVLGHTLSVIILKSELAGKLLERDPVRAKAEIADVEETAREALNEVRSTIRGYRSHSLETELKHARATLETAGMTVDSEYAEIPLSPAQESVVALVVREAVTNVVRHAKAHHCSLRIVPVNGNCRVEIYDDGRGGGMEGNGLRGMRERMEALNGSVERDAKSGTRLTVEFPLRPMRKSDTL